jgi:hypothetical protein
MSKEFTVGEHTYVSSNMDAFLQVDICMIFDDLLRKAVKKDAQNMSSVTVFGCASREDRKFMMSAALSRCKRRDGDGWASVMNGDALMYSDITPKQMVDITWEVLSEFITPFFLEPVSKESNTAGK